MGSTGEGAGTLASGFGATGVVGTGELPALRRNLSFSLANRPFFGAASSASSGAAANSVAGAATGGSSAAPPVIMLNTSAGEITRMSKVSVYPFWGIWSGRRKPRSPRS